MHINAILTNFCSAIWINLISQPLVDVIDHLRLQSLNLSLTLSIEIDKFLQSTLTQISVKSTTLIIAVLILAGLTLILVLILGGRIRPGLIHDFNRKRRRSAIKNQNHVTPEAMESPVTTSSWKDRLHLTDRKSSPKAYAYLIPLEEQLFDFSVRIIALTNKEVTIGSDPEQADLTINHPSIEPCHARIRRNINGTMELYDLKSIAGCWVNYLPVGEDGQVLRDEDYVHIGGIGFRFALKQSRKLNKPAIHLLPSKIPPQLEQNS